MRPIVLGFAGQIASGKSTLSKEISQYLNWERVSFGDYVRTVARSQGQNESREVLQEIGFSLINQGMEKFCHSVLAQVNWKPGQPLVIDGIRHSEIVSILHQIVAPLEFRLVFISVARPIRNTRLIERGSTHYQNHQNIEVHSTEVQVQTLLPTIADLTLDGTQKTEELIQEVVIWMQKSK
jgi:adenylate kinase family enzyme